MPSFAKRENAIRREEVTQPRLRSRELWGQQELTRSSSASKICSFCPVQPFDEFLSIWAKRE